jgi:hypothetical protein
VRAALTALVGACLVLTGCGIGMPDSGPVHVTSPTGSSSDEQPARIDPPPPQKGASREEVVVGFLDAMTATPAVRTSVAREFLTKEARDSWQPTGTVIYGAYLPPRGANEVAVKLVDAYRTDARGAWLGPVSEDDATVTFPMELQDGEWRISQPPPNLLVPTTWYQQRFRQVSLYFFDPSDTILIPEPVFVPRGRQFASTLVNALLQGPSTELSAMEQTYLPVDLRSLVSVPVSPSGVAQIDLTSDTDQSRPPAPDQAELLISQLAWTLRQDPTISKFRLTIDNRPVQLPGESEFSVDHGHQYAPYVAGSTTQLFGLQAGLMVAGSPQNLPAVSGPLGQADYDLRAVTADLRAERVAGVSSAGDTLWLAPVKETGEHARTVLTGGEDLLRPAWDFRGRLWEVDRRSTGAVVYFMHKNQMVPLDVPGISGEDVKHFLVSRDGSRLVAVLHGPAQQDTIVVSRILTTGDGQVAQALAADNISDATSPEGQIRDLAWSSPTSLVLLHPLSRDLFQIRSASVDGATGLAPFSVTIDGKIVSLVGTPVPDETIYAFEPGAGDTSAVLVDLAGPRSNQLRLDPRLTTLSYAG